MKKILILSLLVSALSSCTKSEELQPEEKKGLMYVQVYSVDLDGTKHYSSISAVYR